MSFSQISGHLKLFLQESMDSASKKISIDSKNFNEILKEKSLEFNQELPLDQPYTILQKVPIKSTTFINRAYALLVFFLLMDFILIGLYVYKNRHSIQMQQSKLHKDVMMDTVYTDLHLN